MTHHDTTLGTSSWVQQTSGRMTAAERRGLVAPLMLTHVRNATGRLRMAANLHAGRRAYL